MVLNNELIKEITENTELEFKDEDAKAYYNRIVEKNKDDLPETIPYLDKLAKCTQYLVDKCNYKFDDAIKEARENIHAYCSGNALGFMMYHLCKSWNTVKRLSHIHQSIFEVHSRKSLS